MQLRNVNIFQNILLVLIQTLVQIESSAEEMTEDHETLNPFEGDMILSKRQMEDVYGTMKPRKAINSSEYYWPQGVVFYQIDENGVGNITNTIMEAIRHWEEYTCVKFIKMEEKCNISHVIFTNGTGCSSIVGRQWWNTQGQHIYLDPNCDIMGKVAHEIGHAVGFFHEQSRPDRDQYVKVLEENIDPAMMANFFKRNNIDLDKYAVPYDLSSVMHYSSKAFSVNGKNTLVPLNPMFHFLLGQRKGLSFFDRKLANLVYNCSENCEWIPYCANNGYVDKSCMCQCPTGFCGSSCEKELPIVDDTECGAIINDSSTILSPNYPEEYPESKCVWWIKAPNDSVIEAVFNDFDLINRTTIGECLSAFELRWKDIYDGDTYCGDELNEKSFVSLTNEMVFIFRSSKVMTGRGFNITVSFLENNVR